MGRTRRPWSSIRDTDIRPLMREATPSQAHWGDASTLAIANSTLDLRYLQMAQAHEGWVTNVVTTPIVNGEPDYPMPEGTDRVKRVLIRQVHGSNTSEVELYRNERIGGQVVDSPKAVSGLPTVRFLGNLVRLDPPPRGYESSALLVLEEESPPPRLSGNTSEIPDNYPVIMESVLVWDVLNLAIQLEARLSGQEASEIVAGNPRLAMYSAFDAAFRDFIEPRNYGRVFGRPYTLGD